jgi:small-conductance mechanosensitive channel
MNSFLPPIALLLQAERPVSLLEQITLGRVVSALITLGMAWLLIRAATQSLDMLSLRVARARFFFKRLEPVVRVIIWFAAIFIVTDTLAPSQETFWAGVGSIALALGLGAQDLIKNVIGGLIVLVDRPYQLGDRVKIGDAYGEIDHIGLRSTKLTTPDDTRVTIPNANILTDQVHNANSGVPDCQVVTDLYLPPDVDPDEALGIGWDVAYSSPFLLVRKPVAVLLSDQFDQRPYLRLRIKAYVHDHRFEPRMQSDITARAKREFVKRGMFAGWQRKAASAGV